MEEYMDNCVVRCLECPEGWGLLGKQSPYKEQVAFSRLDCCLRGRCGSLKGLASEHRVSVLLAECGGPRTKETCFLITMTFALFVFQRKLSKWGNQCLLSRALGDGCLEFGTRLLTQESAHGASQLLAPTGRQLPFVLFTCKS